MPNPTTNFFSTANPGFVTTLSSSILSGATTVPLTGVSGLTNGSVFVGIIEPTLTKQQVFTGLVDTAGVQITNVVWVEGANAAHSAGVTIVDYVTSVHHNIVTQGILKQHTQAGAHTAMTTDTLAATGNISTSGGTINAATVSSLQDTSVPLSTYRNENSSSFTASGGVWTGDSYASTLNASMTAWTGYINGQRGTISSVTARAFTASKDTYVDVLNTAGVFTLVYTEVTNNAVSPALAANSMRIAIVVSGGSSIAAAGSVNQGQPNILLPITSSTPYTTTDYLGNLIYNMSPNPRRIGYRQITGNVTATTIAQVTGLSCPVIIPAGRKAKITVTSSGLTNSSANGCTVTIWSGVVNSGTQLQAANFDPYIATARCPINLTAEVQPSLTVATSVTYNAGLASSSGTATLQSGGITSPSIIQVDLL